MSKPNIAGAEKLPLFNFLYILKAVAAGYALSLLLLLPSAILATRLCFSDRAIALTVNLITALSTAVCGFISGRRSERGGLFSGALAGIIYAVFLCLCGNLASQNIHIGMNAVLAAVIGLLCGATGGIVGINTCSRRRR